MMQAAGTERLDCHLVPEVLTTSKTQDSPPEGPQATDLSYRELLED